MIRRPIYPFLLLPALLLPLTGCDVHEFPEPDEPYTSGVQVVLHLDFSLELPPYKEILYSRYSSRATGGAELDLRYIVNYYPVDSRGTPARTPAGSFTVTQDDIEIINHDITLSLPPGEYKFMVWTDYVGQDSALDRFYDTSAFDRITLASPHSGNDDTRDAFRGEAYGEIPEATAVTESGLVEITVPMERPLGKYRFIATDLAPFMERAKEYAREQWEASQAGGTTGAPAEMPAIDLDGYRVRISYPMYMPHVFNMFTNRPCDSRTGVSFEGKMRRLSETEAELGFDYVFVNGSEASVTARVEIFDAGGALVSSTPAIDIPLKRSMLTTVRGEFLTSKATGGVTVDPGFDEDINIFLP